MARPGARGETYRTERRPTSAVGPDVPSGRAEPLPRRGQRGRHSTGRRPADDVARGQGGLDRRGRPQLARDPRVARERTGRRVADAVQRRLDRGVLQVRECRPRVAPPPPRASRRRDGPPGTGRRAGRARRRRRSRSCSPRRPPGASRSRSTEIVSIIPAMTPSDASQGRAGPEQRRLVLLEIALVGERQPLEQGEEPGQRPDRHARRARGRARPGPGSSCSASSSSRSRTRRRPGRTRSAGSTTR